jgi:hypothetical protein
MGKLRMKIKPVNSDARRGHVSQQSPVEASNGAIECPL